MTKETSRSSSIGSAHAPSPDAKDDMVEAQKVSEEPSSIESNAPPTDIASKSAEPDASNAGAAVSQSIPASDSNSSDPSVKDAGASTGPAAPYGTRSRNRTGAARPNYAEDKEIDTDFEMPPAKEITRKGRATATAADAGASEASKASNTSRKTTAAEDEQPVAIQSHSREPIPGTSTFSANPTTGSASTQGPKKRKSTAQSTAQQAQQAGSQATLPVQTVTRRASMAAQIVAGHRETNMLTFENCAGRLKGKKLVADDGTILEVNDHVYLVCEPPGEPYYLGRIMEFLHVSNDNSQPIDALRLNWYYRPKDIGRKVSDTRQVFASMHSDISPLTALRGKCQIKHRSEIDKLDDVKKTKDCFWYEKLYDRYIHRYYDVIPTSQVINVPTEVKKVLDERWRYIVVEPGRGKELTSAVKSCKRCNKYCASNDSVDCAVCQNTYHMSCVNPPLLKKPSRGFAWACGPCSKAQEKKLEARNTPNVTDNSVDAEDEEFNEEEEDSGANGEALDTGRTSPTVSSGAEISIRPETKEQIHQASLWLFRYLGIHCKVEDALDYDDRIYPRASSRLGPRHQANVPVWPGRPVEYIIKPTEVKKKGIKGGGNKKDAKLSVAALEADKIAREKRPKWVQDAPPGYVHRGEDYDNDDPRNTAKLLYKLPEPGQMIFTPSQNDQGKHERPDDTQESDRVQFVYQYLFHAKDLANPIFHLPEMSTNVLDVALETLHDNGYDFDKALRAMMSHDKKIFKEPDLNPTELKRFEDGVAKFGSEWHSIKKHVKSVSAANIVRFYYTWKKTERGKQVWGNYHGRKGKKEAKRSENTAGKLQDDVADDHDDSAFDNDKAFEKKRAFQCKFCGTHSSRQWRRAPNTAAGNMITEAGTKPTAKDKGPLFMVALCQRCAELWRRYAIQWEDIEEVKKTAQASGKTWKRKIDEELLKELEAVNELVGDVHNLPLPTSTSASGTPTPAMSTQQGVEPPRKKLKGAVEKDPADPASESGVPVTTGPKKKAAPEKKAPTPVPEPPKPRTLPCAICGELEPLGDQLVSCRECRLSVHRNCYGVMGESRSSGKWICDMCSNDKNPQVSIQYKCMLCPVDYTEHDFVEPPKVTHKKKTEKDRERDRIEREHAQQVADFFRKKQEELNKPVNPREPLKRTANNNWVHVTCAVFTPEVKFGNAKALEPSEGIPSIASARYEETCKACKQKGGACVACHSCKAPVHVECAHKADYTLGFDITPVKGSRRDQINIVTMNEETGAMTAQIWCKEHVPSKTIVYQMHDVDKETGINALQLYVQNFKQADLTLTGTVRKATLVNQSTKVINTTTHTPNRKSSTITSANGHITSGRGSISHAKFEEPSELPLGNGTPAHKICITCGIDVSPKWWSFPPDPHRNSPVNGDARTNGDHPMLDSNAEQAPIDAVSENGEGAAALAAAALHENCAEVPSEPTEFQCHKCHWKKIPRPGPPVPEAEIQPEQPRPSTNGIGPSINADSGPQAQYTWPAPPVHPTAGSHSGWSHPSPLPQGVPVVNQLNGNHSPVATPAAIQPLNGHVRQSSFGQAHSPPLQNGHVGQLSNGYPSSPHRTMGGPSSVHIPNGYNSYASTRPPPHHLTNGGPPPRAPEHPFNSAPVPARSPFAPAPHGSPPMHHEAPMRESSQPASVRPNGASASPSLRNLLS